MLLTISTDKKPATNLGYLLQKNPTKARQFDITYGNSFLFYPEASEDKCTMALILNLDPLDLVKGQEDKQGNTLQIDHYINDRPYTSSSFTATTISKVLASALKMKSKLPEGVEDVEMPLTVTIYSLSCRGTEKFITDLFTPLGYTIKLTNLNTLYTWGSSNYYNLELTHIIKLSSLLRHLYVLLPVIDNNKHYFIDSSEIDKLLTYGKGWIEQHPMKATILKRYLKYNANMVKQADDIITESLPEVEEVNSEVVNAEDQIEKKLNLRQLRVETILSAIKLTDKSVVDLGCGSGNVLKVLAGLELNEIIGVDVSHTSLTYAKRKLDKVGLTDKVTLLQGSVLYKDSKFKDKDVIVCTEVIEHIQLDRLEEFEEILFGYSNAKKIIITTPNKEYNVNYDFIKEGQLRHKDHKFEWTRKEFLDWVNSINKKYNYNILEMGGIGELDENTGCPTQYVVFRRGER